MMLCNMFKGIDQTRNVYTFELEIKVGSPLIITPLIFHCSHRPASNFERRKSDPI